MDNFFRQHTRRLGPSVVLAGLGLLLASGCGERGRYEREAARSAAEDSVLDGAEVSTVGDGADGLANFDLKALMSRCWSPQRNREELLIRKSDPNLTPNISRAYNFLILNGELQSEEPCFAGVGFSLEVMGFIDSQKTPYRLTAGLHNNGRYLTVERNEGDVSVMMMDLGVDGNINVQVTVGQQGQGTYFNRFFVSNAHLEIIDYFCQHYLDS
ncbi:MAG TPA: hypothetical protein VJG49_00700 [Candidatus Nanoarchaeia archaeon]|nr:hypothetical protein [Candidatus Nanoarchaeia archaeon]